MLRQRGAINLHLEKESFITFLAKPLLYMSNISQQNDYVRNWITTLNMTFFRRLPQK